MPKKFSFEEKIKQGLFTLEPIKEALLFPIRAKKDFPHGSPLQKNKILEKLLWNLEIKDKVLAGVSYKQPYDLIKKAPKKGDFSEMLGRKGILRLRLRSTFRYPSTS